MTMQRTAEVAIQPGRAQAGEIVATLHRLWSSGMHGLKEAFYTTGEQSLYVHFGAVERVPHQVAVSTLNQSYTVTVEVDRPDTRAEGILIALGNEAGGSVVLVHDNQLVHEYHYASACYSIRSDCMVPTGPSTLRFVFTKTGHLRGIGALYIDGRKVGEALIPHTLPYYTAVGGAVASAPFSRELLFTGTVKQVLIETATPPIWSFDSARRYTVLETHQVSEW
jgi:hypothetical protein